MTRNIFAASGVCALVTAVLSAQTTPQPAPGQPGSVAVQTMSLTGCLKPWDPSTMDTSGSGAAGVRGTSGSTATAMPGASASGTPGAATPGATPTAGAPRFVLTDAEHAPATGAGGTTAQGAPSPTTNPNPALGAHGTYVLETQSPTVNFASFVNQQVRVTGTMLMDGAAGGRMTGATGQTGAVAGTSGTNRPAAGATTPTTSTGGTPTTTTGGTPTTSTGGTPTTSVAGTPTASGTPTTGATPTSTMGQRASAAAARVTFAVTSITMVAKTCS